MQAHAIDFQIASVEPETGRSIKAELTEPGPRGHGIDNFSIDQHL